MSEYTHWAAFGFGVLTGVWFCFVLWLSRQMRRGLDHGLRAFGVWLARCFGFPMAQCPSCGHYVERDDLLHPKVPHD